MTNPSDQNLLGDQDHLPMPPVAKQRPHSVTHHGVTLEDPWHWLRDPGYPIVEDPDILGYLKAENAYFEAAMQPHRELVEAIFEEIKGRQQLDLSSVPWRRGYWFYQWSYPLSEGGEGSQYRVWQRWPADGPDAREGPTADAQTILDEPALAKGLGYFSLDDSPAVLGLHAQHPTPLGVEVTYDVAGVGVGHSNFHVHDRFQESGVALVGPLFEGLDCSYLEGHIG